MENVGKVYRYFACECGHTFNEFVYRDTTDLKPTYKSGVYRVNFSAIHKQETATCDKCKNIVESSVDPNGAKTKFLFNFMED